MNAKEMLAAAKAAPEKQNLEEYREVVEVLREKGFTWRETAEFLAERGVSTDHTRLFRLFGPPTEDRISESRKIAISRVTHVGEKRKGNRKTWNVLEIELPTKLGPVVVRGFALDAGASSYAKGPGGSLTLRNPTLKLSSKNKGFPSACITAEFKMQNRKWTSQEVHIVPKWEELL